MGLHNKAGVLVGVVAREGGVCAPMEREFEEGVEVSAVVETEA